jgi:Ca-activated chloride channel family protein
MWESFSKFRDFEWAGTRYAWLGWLILALALWAPIRAFGRRGWGLFLGDPAGLPGTLWARLAWLPGLLRLAGLALCLIALLRPQIVTSESRSSVQALDIFLCLDISGSMRADDARPSRLAAAKESLHQFVKGLRGDRVGLVVFTGKAFVQCPLTLDHDIVDYFIDQVDFDTIRLGGTAVGDGLLAAVSRLMKEPGRNQVVVLATDGVSNTGTDPLQAARLAGSAGIKVYTIGIGRKGGGEVSVTDPFGRVFRQHMEEPDEPVLRSMAESTGGQYFRATDESVLRQAYQRIGQLEKHEIKVRNWKNAEEFYFLFLLIGAVLLGLEALLRLRIRVMA